MLVRLVDRCAWAAAADEVQSARKVQGGEDKAAKAAKDAAENELRRELIIEDRRALTLTELSTADRALTQKGLRLYCGVMQLSSKGSPAELRAMLEARMNAAGISVYRAGDALGSGS